MSKKAVIKLNRAGVKALMQSEEMQSVLQKSASAIRDRCGDGYEQDIRVGKNRANAQVWAESSKAKRDNAANNTILKAVR